MRGEGKRYRHTERRRDTERDTETDRQTDTHTQSQTDRNRQAHRERQTGTDRDRGTHTESQIIKYFTICLQYCHCYNINCHNNYARGVIQPNVCIIMVF